MRRKRKETVGNCWKNLKRWKCIWWLNYVQFSFKKKKKIPIIPNGFPEGSKCKRNFKNASENDRNTLSRVKDTRTPETPPVD